MYNIPSGSFMFKASVEKIKDLPEDAKAGEIYHIESISSEYIYTGDKWVELYSAKNNESPKKIVYPSNCKNCGAILHNAICEYCSTDNSIMEGGE